MERIIAAQNKFNIMNNKIIALARENRIKKGISVSEDPAVDDYTEAEYDYAKQQYEAASRQETESPKPSDEYIETPAPDDVEEHTEPKRATLSKCMTLDDFTQQVAVNHNTTPTKRQMDGIHFDSNIVTKNLSLQVEGTPDINLGKVVTEKYEGHDTSDLKSGTRTIVLENATIVKNIDRTGFTTKYTYILTQNTNNTPLNSDQCSVCYALNGGGNQKSTKNPAKRKSRRNPKKSKRQKKSCRNRKR